MCLQIQFIWIIRHVIWRKALEFLNEKHFFLEISNEIALLFFKTKIQQKNRYKKKNLKPARELNFIYAYFFF